MALCAAKKNKHLWTLIKRAKANLRTCIAQNEKRLFFPDLFAPTIPPPRSPLHWNVKKYPKNSLVSLITALDAVGVCTNSKGEQSPFIAIVKEFEYLFNTPLPNAYARRDELLGRGESRVRFLRELVRSLGGIEQM